MLTWMRRQSGKPWAKAIYIALTLAFFGGFGMLSSTKIQSCMGMEGNNPKGDVLATIDRDTTITEGDWRLLLKQRVQQRMAWLQKQYPDQHIPENVIDQEKLGAEVMDNLIQRDLLLKEAKKLGIKVSDQEVQDQIARYFTDQTTHTFNDDNYRASLRYQGLSEKDFEERVRGDQVMGKVMDLVRDSIGALPEEVKERYAFEHGKVKVDYLALDPSKVAADVEPGDTAVSDYYRKHQESYLLGPTRRVEYVSWALADIKTGATVTEDEIQQNYERGKDRYMTKPEEVRTSDILVRVDRDAPEKDIQDAKVVIDKLYADVTAPGADFAQVARDHSEGPDKDSGGDMGWYTKGEYASQFKLPSMDQDITDVAFDLKKGEISKPFLTQFGWRILKKTGTKPAEYMPLSAVKDDIREDIIHGKKLALAQDKAEKVKAAVAGGKSFADAAKDAGKEVKLSDWFEESDDQILGMEDSATIVEAAFKPKEKEGVMSDPVAGLDHVYLFRPTDFKPARQGSLQEVRNRIVAILKPGAEHEATVKKAQGYLEKLSSGGLDMAGLAKELGIELQTTDLMERDQIMLTGVGYSDTLESSVAVLDKDHPWPDKPVTVQDKVVILHFLESAPPDMSKWDADKDSYTRQYLSKKRDEMTDQWLKQLRDDRVTFTDRWNEIRPGK